MPVEKYGWAIQKSLFAQTNQDSTFSHTRENAKMFNVISKYFKNIFSGMQLYNKKYHQKLNHF